VSARTAGSGGSSAAEVGASRAVRLPQLARKATMSIVAVRANASHPSSFSAPVVLATAALQRKSLELIEKVRGGDQTLRR